MASTNTWSNDDEIHLLAWLDFCKDTKAGFEDSVLSHLMKISGKNFSEKEVRQQLAVLAQRGSYASAANYSTALLGESAWQEMKEKGSKFFEDSPIRTRQRIKKVLAEYHRNGGEVLPIAPVRRSSVTPNKFLGRSQHREDRSKAGIGDDTGPDVTTENLRGTSTEAWNIREIKEDQTRQKRDKDATPTTQRTKEAEAALNQQSPARKIWRKDAVIAEIRSLWREEVEALYHREHELLKTIDELEAQRQNLRLARDESSKAVNDPLQDSLFIKNQEIWKLTQRLHETERVSGLSGIGDRAEKPFDMAEIDEAMDRIQSELESGSFANRRLQVPVITARTRDSDLGILLRCVLSISPAEPHTKGLRMFIFKFPADYVVQAFTLAAVKEWVFLTDFPKFSRHRDRYLDIYRQMIFEAGGWKQLHEFDREATRRLLKSASYQNATLPRSAAELAARLVEALSPLLVNGREESESGCLSSGRGETAQREWKECLTMIFEIALNLKAVTVMTGYQYEFIMESSRTAPPEGRGTNSFANDWLKICSLNVYPSGGSLANGSRRDALTNPRNFIERAPGTKVREAMHTKEIVVEIQLQHRTQGEVSERTVEPNAIREDSTPQKHSQPRYALTSMSGPKPSATSEQTNVRTPKKVYEDGELQSASKGTSELLPNSSDGVVLKGWWVGYPDSPTKIPTEGNGLECEKCGRSFTSQRTLDGHHKKGTYTQSPDCTASAKLLWMDEDERPCSICGDSFCHIADLRKHVRSEHPDVFQTARSNKSPAVNCAVGECETPPYETDIVAEEDPKDAVRGWTNIKTFRNCPLCDLEFSSEAYFSRHLRCYHDPTPMQCLQCQIVCKSNALLDKHLEEGCGVQADMIASGGKSREASSRLTKLDVRSTDGQSTNKLQMEESGIYSRQKKAQMAGRGKRPISDEHSIQDLTSKDVISEHDSPQEEMKPSQCRDDEPSGKRRQNTSMEANLLPGKSTPAAKRRRLIDDSFPSNEEAQWQLNHSATAEDGTVQERRGEAQSLCFPC